MENTQQFNSVRATVQTNVTLSDDTASMPSIDSNHDLMSSIKSILPTDGILPKNKGDAIKGDELIKRIMKHLPNACKEGTIRNYLSQLSRMEDSPLAKSKHRHGYFLRETTDAPTDGVQDESSDVDQSPAADCSGRDLQSEEKVRGLVVNINQQPNQFTFAIEHTKSQRGSKGSNVWIHPDAIEVQFGSGVTVQIGKKIAFDETMLGFRCAMGEPFINLTSIELKVDVTMSNVKEAFFQCLSNSNWANSARLVIANRIEDKKVVQILKNLGRQFGVTVVCYNLNRSMLEKLPPASQIGNLPQAERNKLLIDYCSNITIIYEARSSPQFDWEYLGNLKRMNPDVDDVIKWITACFQDSYLHSFSAFKQREKDNYQIKYQNSHNRYTH